MLSNIQLNKIRQEEILQSFEVLRFATRQQLQKIHDLKSDRNALKILGRMKEYFHVQVFQGMNVYYLNKEGRALVGIEKDLKWTLQVGHDLMRNDVYVHYKCPKDWRIEHEMGFVPQLSTIEKFIVADATFTFEGRFHILEVDRTQNMVDNRRKIDTYAEFWPLLRAKFGHDPSLIFYTETPVRQESLKKYCTSKKVNCLVITKKDLF